MKKVHQSTITFPDNKKQPQPIEVQVWEHDGNRIEISYNKNTGFFAMLNNNINDLGHSSPNDPVGIIRWVLERLGVL